MHKLTFRFTGFIENLKAAKYLWYELNTASTKPNKVSESPLSLRVAAVI